VTQVVGGGRGRLAGDTDGLAGVRRWAVEVRVFTHAHVSMITYRVDVYRSRLIGASLLAGRGRPGADADRYRCACLMQGLAGRGDGCQCGQDWGHSSIVLLLLLLQYIHLTAFFQNNQSKLAPER